MRDLTPLPPGWARCGTCERQWDDTIITDVTPAPAGRCPYEDSHPAPAKERKGTQAMRSNVRVNVNPVADRSAADEKIIEFTTSDGKLGGLIAFRYDGTTLTLEPYRLDAGVTITTPAAERYTEYHVWRGGKSVRLLRTSSLAFAREEVATDAEHHPGCEYRIETWDITATRAETEIIRGTEGQRP
jgi:hypothetical protein